MMYCSEIERCVCTRSMVSANISSQVSIFTFSHLSVLKGMESIFNTSQNIGKDFRFYKEIKFEKGNVYQVILQIFYDDKKTTKEIFIDDNVMMNKLNDYGEFWKKN